MNKWTLLAGVTFLSVLGVCYTFLAHQGFPVLSRAPLDGHGSGSDEFASDFNASDVPLDEDGDNTFNIDDDENQAALAKGGASPTADAPTVGGVTTSTRDSAGGKTPIETIEDEDDGGMGLEAEDEDGVLEPADGGGASQKNMTPRSVPPVQKTPPPTPTTTNPQPAPSTAPAKK